MQASYKMRNPLVSFEIITENAKCFMHICSEQFEYPKGWILARHVHVSVCPAAKKQDSRLILAWALISTLKMCKIACLVCLHQFRVFHRRHSVDYNLDRDAYSANQTFMAPPDRPLIEGITRDYDISTCFFFSDIEVFSETK